MCILFVYRNPKAVENSYRLIVASNRDEIYKRPAKPAHYWPKYPDCLGGTDNEPGKEGGAWFALSTTGRVGITLNLSGESQTPNNTGKGRGSLVVDYITSDDSAENYLKKLHDVNQKFQKYNPYHLILLDMHDASVEYLTSSQHFDGPLKFESDVLGVSNSPIDRPYKKVQYGVEEMRKIAKECTVFDRNCLIKELLGLLKSKKRNLPDPELQKRSPNAYEECSSIFVEHEKLEYGTRACSVLLVDGSDNLTFVEETRMPDGTWTSQTFERTLQSRGTE